MDHVREGVDGDGEAVHWRFRVIEGDDEDVVGVAKGGAERVVQGWASQGEAAAVDVDVEGQRRVAGLVGFGDEDAVGQRRVAGVAFCELGEDCRVADEREAQNSKPDSYQPFKEAQREAIADALQKREPSRAVS